MTPRQVSVAIIWRDGEVLVARRRSDDQFDGRWEFPGGKIEPGETPEQTAARECLEEIGLLVHTIRSLGSIRHDYGSFAVEIHAILCSPADDSASALTDSNQTRWVELAKLSELSMPAANAKLIRLLLDQQASL